MNKIALVTGAGGGIGRAICIALAKDGMDIAVHYNGNQAKAEETARLCEELGANTKIFKADVSKYEECENLVEQVIESFGALHVLVNNAGITKDGMFIRMKETDFDVVMDANLKGSFFVSRFAATHMMKARYGKIVNITSVVGIGGNAGQTNYSASKAGLIGFTKSCAKEMGKRNVLVNAVAPGFVDTEMTAVLSEKVKEKILENIAIGTMARPEDVANAVSFFVSENNKYITGQVLAVDGGMNI